MGLGGVLVKAKGENLKKVIGILLAMAQLSVIAVVVTVALRGERLIEIHLGDFLPESTERFMRVESGILGEDVVVATDVEGNSYYITTGTGSLVLNGNKYKVIYLKDDVLILNSESEIKVTDAVTVGEKVSKDYPVRFGGYRKLNESDFIVFNLGMKQFRFETNSLANSSVVLDNDSTQSYKINIKSLNIPEGEVLINSIEVEESE